MLAALKPSSKLCFKRFYKLLLINGFAFLTLIIITAQASDTWVDNLSIRNAKRANSSKLTTSPINSAEADLSSSFDAILPVSDNEELFSDQSINQTQTTNLSVNNPAECTTTPISFGQTVSETISTSDCTDGFRFYDQFTFTGTANQNIAVTMNSSAFDTYAQLYNANGQRIAVRLGFPNAHLIFTIPSDGNYTIVATSGTKGLTGTYGVTLVDNGICTGIITAINIGEIKNGSLSTSDCITSRDNHNTYSDDYSLNGASGQKIIITITSNAFNAALQLYNSSGQFLAGSSDISVGNSRILFTLPADGSYVIRVRANFSSANLTGAYALGLFNDVPCMTALISFDQTVSGSLSTTDCITGSGYSDDYTFSATAGQKISFRMISNSFNTRLELYNSNGQLIIDSNGVMNSLLLYTVPTTGIYIIRAASSTINSTGPYALFSFNNVCVPKEISFGIGVSDSLFGADCHDGSRYYDDYTFLGVPGQRITILMSGSFDTLLQLYNLNGQQLLASNNNGANSSISFTLPASGTLTYRIRATSVSTAIGHYTLALTDSATCNPTPTPIGFGQTINGSLSTTDCFDGFRHYDDYTFSATAGRRITFELNSPAFNTQMELFNSNGQSIAFRIGFPDARLLLTIPADGTYTIRASSSDSNRTGDYTIAFTDNGICNPTPTPIGFGQRIAAMLSTGDCIEDNFSGGNFYYDDYTFNGTSGQRIIVTMNSTSVDAKVRLFDSNSRETAFDRNAGSANSRLVYTIPANGTYRIRATSRAENQTGGYALTLINNVACDLNPIPVSFGQTIDNSLSNTDCYNGYYYDSYTFSGVFGQNITVSMNSTAFVAHLELYDSTGQYLIAGENSVSETNSRLNFVIPASGTYTIRATSSGLNRTGAYAISLNNNTALCVPPPLGLIGWFKGDGGFMDSSANSSDSISPFNVNFSSGKVGQAMYFNGSDSFLNKDYLLDPSNRLSGQITLAAWVKPATLGGSQTIISKYDSVADQTGFYLSLSGGKLYFQVNQNDSVSRSVITNNEVISAGVYRHIAAVFNASTRQMEIFVDGASVPVTLVNSGTVASIQEEFFTRLSLGILSAAGDQPAQLFRGQIDEAQIFNRQLSASEIQSIYNADGAGVCAFSSVSGRTTTGSGLPLRDVPIRTSDGLRAVQTNHSGNYIISLEPGYNHSLTPKLSTHSFSPSAHSFNPLTGVQIEKNFTASILNDNFAGAVALSGESGEVDGINQGATRETGEPIHAGTLGGTSVWYRWRAPRNGQFTFSLGGSKFDTLLAVYRGTSLDNLTQIAANDNIPGTGTFSRLTFAAAANTDYWIAIDGRAGEAESGFFKMIYHPADYAPGLTISGEVRTGRCVNTIFPVRGATIKAETLNGEIIATALTGADGTYSIVLPQGVNSFKLTAFDARNVYGFRIFTNITQSRTYNFIISPQNCAIVATSIVGNLLLGGDLSNVTLTLTGPDVTPFQCPVSGVTFVCPELLPYGTYTVTPSHPTLTFSPASRTYVNLAGNITGASFLANNPGGLTISGRVVRENVPLNGVKVVVNARRTPQEAGVSLDTETDANGNYSFTQLPQSFNYNLSASLPGFNLQPLGITAFTDLQNNQTVDFTASSGCSYSVSPLEQNIPASGGFHFFNISTNTGCPWQAKTNSSGLTVTSPLSYGNGTVSYFAEANAGAARRGTINVAGQTVIVNQSAGGGTLYDFDGDRRADIGVFRPSDGTWYLQQSGAGFAAVQFGVSTDKIVPADYDGDGRTDVAVFRNGIWYLQRSSGGFLGISFGLSTDLPIPADFDGDGKAEVALFRPTDGTWYIYNLTNNQLNAVQFGQLGDIPTAADYDGDGRADIAVFRNGVWYLLRSRDGFAAVVFGQLEDKPVPADYDGDGRSDIAVFRPSNGAWYLQQSSAGFTGVQFGIFSDKPVPADYDGDGRSDIAVFRDGNWYLQLSRQGFAGVGFGIATDKPVSNAFVP